MEDVINNLDELKEFYENEDGTVEYDWKDIVQNFPLSEEFILNNINNIDKTLLLKEQTLELSFLAENIIMFGLNEVIEYQKITDKKVISIFKECSEINTNEYLKKY